MSSKCISNYAQTHTQLLKQKRHIVTSISLLFPFRINIFKFVKHLNLACCVIACVCAHFRRHQTYAGQRTNNTLSLSARWKKTCVKLVVGANFRQMCHENFYRILYKANARARFDQNLVRIVWQLSSLNLPWNYREKQIERVFNMSRFMHLFCLICGIY